MFDGDDSPKKETAWYDPETERLLTKNITEAIRPKESLVKEEIQNLDTALPTFDELSPLNTAVNQKYRGLLSRETDDKKARARLGARDMQLANIKRAQHAVLAQEAVQNDAYANYLQAQTMQESARSSALRGILGGAGTIAGIGAAGGFGGQQPQGTSVTTASAIDPKPMMGSDVYNPGLRQSQQYRHDLDTRMD